MLWWQPAKPQKRDAEIMEYALKIAQVPKGKPKRSLVKIEELDGQTTGNFVCPDDNCSVPIFPIFPDRAKRSQRPYFRAGARQGHVNNCRQDGGLRYKAKVDSSRCGAVVDNPPGICSNFPVRFLRARGDATEGHNTGLQEEDRLESLGTEPRYSRSNAADHPQSKRGSELI